MRSHTVEKIGGTSIANSAAVIDNVLIGDRSGDALYNRIFVVSAYAGVTDRLLEGKKSETAGVYTLFALPNSESRWLDALDQVEKQMQSINIRVLGVDGDIDMAHRFVRDRIDWVQTRLTDLAQDCVSEDSLATARELLASIGEAHSAHNTALVLRSLGVNTKFVDLSICASGPELPLDDHIMSALAPLDLRHELPVVTGYAASREGLVARHGRGYTEVTFSRIVAITHPRMAVIHKEFNISTGDPNIVGVGNVRKIKTINYDTAIRLANLGMEALHPGAIKQLGEAQIPLRVSNTFQKHDVGTMIQNDCDSDRLSTGIVTGVKHAYAVEISNCGMNAAMQEVVVNEIVASTDMRVIASASHMNTSRYYFVGALPSVELVVMHLREKISAANISMRKISVVAVLGNQEVRTNLLAQTMTTLTDNGVKFQSLHQIAGAADILAIIGVDDFERAVVTLHRTFVEQDRDLQAHQDSRLKDYA